MEDHDVEKEEDDDVEEENDDDDDVAAAADDSDGDGEDDDEDDNAEDEVEDEAVEDDDVERERKMMMLRRIMLRRMMTRMVMLRLPGRAQLNAWQHFRRATFYGGNLQKTMPRPRLSPERRHTFCASLRRRNACQDFTRATLSGNSEEKCRAPDWARNADAHFAWACAVEIHVHMSQETSEEPLYTEIYRKNAAAQSEHPDQAPAFTVDTLFGE